MSRHGEQYLPLRRCLRLVPLVLMAACGGTQTEMGSTGEGLEQCSAATTFGIDVSDGQGTINWASVRGAGVRFAFMKATQGTYNTNWTFARNWSGARAEGIVRVPYHFFDPTQDGVAQADHFLSVVGSFAAGDPGPMLDVECPDGDSSCLGWSGATGWATGANIKQRMVDFMNTIKSRTGKDTIIYTFHSYFSGAGVNTTGLQSHPLFIADLSSGAGCVNVPLPWTKADFRQYSWHGHVAGIGPEVDLDVFMGTAAQLQAFANSTGTTTAAAECSSYTLDRNVPTGTCVEASTDEKWYTCENGNWVGGENNCASTYPWCNSATMGRLVPPRTCVHSKFDGVEYQCGINGGWYSGVTNGSGPVGACSQMLP